MNYDGLTAASEKMRARGLDPLAITVFEHYYRQLRDGAGCFIPEESIEPLADLPSLAEFVADDATRAQALAKTVVLKLNGGLGTSMGLTGPKTVLPVRDGLSFLDITARQVLALRKQYGVAIPLLLMNSFRTSEESLAALARYPDLAVEGLPLEFHQNAEPKLRQADFTPVEWPSDPELEWCPPGHGDVYVALAASGVLKQLRDKGFRYLFLSNGDNLGATCDPNIAAWMMQSGAPFVSEVCDRTRNDRKGGHLAVRKSDGRLVLRESAMVIDGEAHHFQDITRHRYFHANNLWVDLDVLDQLLTERKGVLGLPVIINKKTVDPRDAASTPVIQLETAMGTAIETFEGAQAIYVPRTRFRPVKTTNELLLLRSDVYTLDEACHIVSLIDHDEPFIDLDSCCKLLPDFEARFPAGAPSLRDCASLRVEGDITFGEGVVCEGDVHVRAAEPRIIPDGARLHGQC